MKRLIILFLLVSIQNIYAQNKNNSVSNQKTVLSDSAKTANRARANNNHKGEVFPEFEFKINDSVTISKAGLMGKVTFINFWFESCHPCIAELDGLSQMYDLLKINKDFRYFSFSIDNDKMIAENIIKFKIPYTVYHLNRDDCGKILCGSFPTSIIIDRNGKIIQLFHSGFLDKEKATKMVMEEIYPKIQTEF
ncbi:MAG: TlpA disulfide reductase family protein [Bacteroidetes bacterium]|nr:TlpA disulfide reductase family protein [Bacteroidota bacterium]